MNELQIFNNAEFGQVRTVTINNEPWFVGKDVAEALGYGNTKDALKAHVDDEDKRIMKRSDFTTIDIPNRGMTIINESGLYALIFGSKLPSAKKFKRWVTSEVLPEIRKTGSFGSSTVPPVKNLHDVVDYIKIIKETASNNGCSDDEISEIVERVSDQFGVQLPRCYVRPKETTLQDVFDWIDYIFSCPRGRGYKKPTYEDYVAARTICTDHLLKE